MIYKKWNYNNGQIIIKHYEGVLILNEVLKNQKNLYPVLRNDQKPKIFLTDLSKATLSEIDRPDILQVSTMLKEFIEDMNGIKVAIYTGMNRHDDFIKIMDYSRSQELSSISHLVFSHLTTAMIWLGLPEADQSAIAKLLMDD